MLKVLPNIESKISVDTALVVSHAMTMPHLRDQGNEDAFQKVLQIISARRRVFEVGVEWVKPAPDNFTDLIPVQVTLNEWTAHGSNQEQIAEMDFSADRRYLRFS